MVLILCKPVYTKVKILETSGDIFKEPFSLKTCDLGTKERLFIFKMIFF